jgi:hypothetical protein
VYKIGLNSEGWGMRLLARGNGFSVFQGFFVSVKFVPVLYSLEELKREPLTEISKRIEEYTGRIFVSHDQIDSRKCTHCKQFYVCVFPKKI